MLELQKLFDSIRIVEDDLKDEIRSVAVVETVSKDFFIAEQQKYIKWLVIVIAGKVRVWQENEDRQILLYYVKPVQTCVLSLSATFRDCKSVINAKTEEESVIVKIPVRYATEWSFRYKSWNTFTTNSFIYSYDDLLYSFKSLAFNKIDKRLMDYLQAASKSQNTNIIAISHNQLAKEIGTTREVISKILKQFELSGRVKLRFKNIELLN